MIADVLENRNKVRSAAPLEAMLSKVRDRIAAGHSPDLPDDLITLYDGQVEYSEGIEQSDKFGNELRHCVCRAARRI